MADAMREGEGSGATLAEAVEHAAAALGLRGDEVRVEVLAESGRGWLGLRRPQVRVRVERLAKGEAAERLLRRLAETMGWSARVSAEELVHPAGGWLVKVDAEDAALWIGRHGHTLDALQVWCDAAATRVAGSRGGLRIDVAGYRERRDKELEWLADRAAADVRRRGGPVTLEPMSAADRRVIHLALEKRAGIETESVGSEPNRRVVVRKSEVGT